MRAHLAGVGEKLEDLARLSVGGDVVILRLAAEQEVAHAAADQVCLKPRAPDGLQ